MTYNKIRPSMEAQYSDVTCDSCGVEPKPMFGVWYGLQPEDGLTVSLGTGYGMAYDSMRPARTVVLCPECTQKLLNDHPYLRKALEEAE